MQRRDVIFGASRLAALMAWQRLFAAPASAEGPIEPWQSEFPPFKLGVASGEPLPNSVVIWTRLAPKYWLADGGMPARPVPVSWEVAHDEHFAQVVQRGEFAARGERAHSVHVEVTGLQSDQRYFYRFRAGGHVSPVGRTRTAPDPQSMPRRLRLALASCQHYEMGYFTAHREIAQADIDLVVFVGDYIYETGAAAHWQLRQHAHSFNDEDLTLENYRIHHANYKFDADLRACHAAHPWLLTWDDHDVRNDYDGLHDTDGLSVEAFTKVRAAAYQAYFEHLPISPRRAPVGPDAAMHTAYQWGRLADFWLLDTRQFRSGSACEWPHELFKGRLLWQCKDSAAPERTVLGMPQEQWLAKGLAASQSAWRLVVQTTQITPGPFKTPWGPLLYADGWDAFPAARDRLMAAIVQAGARDVVCLGGDVHRHVAANLRAHPLDPKSPIVASEIVASSITSRGLSELLTDWMRTGNPDLLHLRSDERGYALIQIDQKQLRCDFRATAHPVRPDSRLHTQASFVVQRGTPGLKRA